MKKIANLALQLHLDVTAKVMLDPIISTDISDWGSILGRENTAFQIAGEICHPDLPEHFLRGGLKNLAILRLTQTTQARESCSCCCNSCIVSADRRFLTGVLSDNGEAAQRISV